MKECVSGASAGDRVRGSETGRHWGAGGGGMRAVLGTMIGGKGRAPDVVVGAAEEHHQAVPVRAGEGGAVLDGNVHRLPAGSVPEAALCERHRAGRVSSPRMQ